MKITGEEKHKHCLNCGSSFKGNFCPNCGQKAGVKRLKITEIVMDMANSLVGGDNKFYCTCRDLSCRPGHMVRNYLLGKRAKYYNPLQMYIFTLTAFAVAAFLIGDSSTTIENIITWGFKAEDEILEESRYASVEEIMTLMNDLLSNKLYGTLFFSFFGTFPYRVLFRKERIVRPDGVALPLNLTEQFYTQMFLACIGMILSIVMLPLCLTGISEDTLRGFYCVIAFIYSVVIFKQLLGIGWLKSALKNVLGIFFTFIIAFGLIFIVMVTAGVIEGLNK